MSRATARTLKAEGEFAPLHFTGMNIYTDGFKMRGGEDAAFSSLAIDQIRADLSLGRWRERVWQVDHVEAQRVELRVDGSRIALAPEQAAPAARGSGAFAGWLPNRVEIATAAVRDANLFWGNEASGAGSVRRVNVAATQDAGAWDILANGGRIEQGSLPGLDLTSAHLVFRAPSLFVQSAELRQGATGSVSVAGEVRFDDEVDLHAKLAGIDLAPFLNDDWRVRLHGRASGEVRVQGPLPSRNAPVVSGSMQIADGQIEALPMLDEIATFTHLDQYRRLTLSRASADFRQENGTLRATNFIIESSGLMRIEGGFTVVNGTIDGAFRVGVSPKSVDWMPGAREHVFTEAAGGYVWTPMRLSGPLAKPGEDLSPRLAAAAKDAAVEKVESTVKGAVETGKSVIKSALDTLMPLFK